MRKIIVFMMLVSIGLFIGCGNKAKDKATEDNKNNEVVTNSEEANTSNTNNDKEENNEVDKSEDKNESDEITGDEVLESKKEYYLEKYDSLEKELKDSLAEKYNGTTIDMREAAGVEYTSWDDLLNEIYGILQEQLSEEEMEAVKEEQINWLTIRDSRAEESAKEVEGGTMEPLVYTSSLAEGTKERCYELISKYMK